MPAHEIVEAPEHPDKRVLLVRAQEFQRQTKFKAGEKRQKPH